MYNKILNQLGLSFKPGENPLIFEFSKKEKFSDTQRLAILEKAKEFGKDRIGFYHHIPEAEKGDFFRCLINILNYTNFISDKNEESLAQDRCFIIAYDMARVLYKLPEKFHGMVRCFLLTSWSINNEWADEGSSQDQMIGGFYTKMSARYLKYLMYQLNEFLCDNFQLDIEPAENTPDNEKKAQIILLNLFYELCMSFNSTFLNDHGKETFVKGDFKSESFGPSSFKKLKNLFDETINDHLVVLKEESPEKHDQVKVFLDYKLNLLKELSEGFVSVIAATDYSMIRTMNDGFAANMIIHETAHAVHNYLVTTKKWKDEYEKVFQENFQNKNLLEGLLTEQMAIYSQTNLDEFIACSCEAFIIRSQQLKEKAPELFDTWSEILNQEHPIANPKAKDGVLSVIKWTWYQLKDINKGEKSFALNTIDNLIEKTKDIKKDAA